MFVAFHLKVERKLTFNERFARIAKTSNELSSSDYLVEVENAIDEICKLNILGLYTKLVIYE